VDKNSLSAKNNSQIAKDSVYSCLVKAEKYYQCTFPLGEVLFNLRGRAAGQVRFPINSKKDDLPEIRFNPYLLNIYGEEFINEVVPHECAHLVVYRLYQLKKYKSKIKPKPHGAEWKFVMQEIYGLKPRVTHTFEVKVSTMKRFPYSCACHGKIHQLTVIRHNKVIKQASNYLCRRCGEKLSSVDLCEVE
jgi:SprT protein